MSLSSRVVGEKKKMSVCDVATVSVCIGLSNGFHAQDCC